MYFSPQLFPSGRSFVRLSAKFKKSNVNGGNMRSGCFWYVLCLVVLSVLPAIAQTQGGISGVIHDSTGAVIPGVTVTVTNPATNFVRSAISNEAGVYNFPVFFFSSRRRHTRWNCDWSSDVCSSDL